MKSLAQSTRRHGETTKNSPRSCKEIRSVALAPHLDKTYDHEYKNHSINGAPYHNNFFHLLLLFLCLILRVGGRDVLPLLLDGGFPDFTSLFPKKRLPTNNRIATIPPAVNCVSCDNPPRMIAPRTILPNTSLPKSDSIFAISSLRVVRFFAFFTGDFFRFFMHSILHHAVFYPKKHDKCHIRRPRILPRTITNHTNKEEPRIHHGVSRSFTEECHKKMPFM